MNLDALLQRGRTPWEPNARVRDVEPWHLDDVPTLGTFRLDDSVILFANVGDMDMRLTIWVYGCLNASETDALDTLRFADHKAMRDWVNTALSHRQVAIATAWGLRIRHYTQTAAGDDHLDAALDFLDQLAVSMSSDPLQHAEPRQERIEYAQRRVSELVG